MAQAYVFDAYGTLFDVHSAVAANAQSIGADAPVLSDLWRSKQLEYSWVLSLMGRYADFWELTEHGLDYALAATGRAGDSDLRTRLLDAYRTLKAYDEVPEVLAALRDRGAKTAILSNANTTMLTDAVNAAGLDGLLDALLSVETVKVFKTDRRVYDMVESHLGVPPTDVAFQSSNAWDAAGAATHGFTVHWINRAGKPAEYPMCGPVTELKDLRGLL